MLEAIKIILLAVVAAMLYGILHDQITARVCVEYFTIGHPPVFDTDDPTLLACGWGVIATWWVGVLLGVPAALVAQVGRWPKVAAERLIRPIAVILAVMAVCALVAGLIGSYLGRTGQMVLVGPLAARIPPEKHAAFMADAWAHEASYGSGFLGGVILWIWIIRQRRRNASIET